MPLIFDSGKYVEGTLKDLLDAQQVGLEGLMSALRAGQIPVRRADDTRVLEEFLEAVCALGSLVRADSHAAVEVVARVINLQYEAVNVILIGASLPVLADRAAAARKAKKTDGTA